MTVAMQTFLNTGTLNRLFLVVTLLVMNMAAGPVRADFALNFSHPSTSNWTQGSGSGNFFAYCGPDQTYSTCTSNNGDKTSFLTEHAVVDGENYMHTVVGDPSTGFAQESYTRLRSLNGSFTENDANMGSGYRMFSPDGGGIEQLYTGGAFSIGSSSGGIYNGADPFGTWMAAQPGHSADGFRSSGSGDHNPSKMAFRMYLNTQDGVSVEVYKPFLDGKPEIRQTVTDGTLSAQFVTDMRALSYSDMSTPAPLVNNVSITEPGLPAGAGDFEMAFAQQAHVTAGQYIFTPGAGWNDPANGPHVAGSYFDPGTYTYSESSPFNFDPLTADWASFFDSSANAAACAGSRNSWSCPP